MARQTLTEKTARCVRLLLGLRHTDIQKALATHGLTDEVIHKGWALMTEVGMARIRATPMVEDEGARSQPFQELAELQDTWFPVARSALSAHFPEISVAFFSGLTRQRGPVVVFSTTTFFGRLRELAEGAKPYGEAGPAARRLLTDRGLTPDVEERAAAALRVWRELAARDWECQDGIAAEEEALADLWAFYLEWSAIASSTLTNPAHLRWLGLATTERPPARSSITKRTRVQVRAHRLPGTREN